MEAKWDVTEVSSQRGPLLLRTWCGPSNVECWYASAHLWVSDPITEDKQLRAYHSIGSDLYTERYQTSEAACAALDAWAAKIGPVEPVLALVLCWRFDRDRPTKRRMAAHGEAA